MLTWCPSLWYLAWWRRAVGCHGAAMEESTRLGYCIVAGSFVSFQFFFSAVSPQLSLALSPHYGRLPSGKKQEWNSRCVSTLHALIVGLFCLYILYFDEAINANPIW
nr:transmembrane protein 56-B-like [Pelodiscus sinensis]|eukprot:XP_014429925.1 transmembrane protein 56-B-like [Pelodiscus sinensis]